MADLVYLGTSFISRLTAVPSRNVIVAGRQQLTWERSHHTSTSREEPQTPWVDPIGAEIHASRERIVAACNGDLHALCEQLRAHEQTAGRVPVPHESRPPRPGQPPS